jgi:hypothetical protein
MAWHTCVENLRLYFMGASPQTPGPRKLDFTDFYGTLFTGACPRTPGSRKLDLYDIPI